MRVVHIGRYYGERNTGGAAIAATRLHRVLRANGVDSVFLCFDNRSDEEVDVLEVPPKGSSCRFLVVLFAKISRNIWRLFGRSHKVRSLHIVHTGILKVIESLHPDIVHVHWFTDECASLNELEQLPCPLVMHLHDMWMLNGFDSYPHEDIRYVQGFNRSNSSLLERMLWKRKCRLAHQKNVTFIGPSKWVKERADESVVAKRCRNFHVPYFQDDKFSFHSEMRLPHERFRILFGAYAGRSNPIKGFADLQAAIEHLPSGIQEQCELLMFGEEAADYVISKVKVHFLGIAKSAEELVGFYNQADIFAFPSKEETWGQTKSEALLCGLPVVAFHRTACPEGIEHGKNGWIAADGDIDAYSKGIEHFFRLWHSGVLRDMHRAIAENSRVRFNNQAVLERLIAVYRSII